MSHPLLDRLQQGPILFDGAMGTLLYERGIPLDHCFDELNLSQPDLIVEIHRRAAKNAREAREISGQPALIAGSIGPTGRTLAPIGTTAPNLVREAYQEQASALLEGGVDLLIIETISSLDEMREAVLAAREVTDLPIIAQMTFAE